MTDDRPTANFVTRVECEPEHDKPGYAPAIDEIVTGPADMVHVERMNPHCFWMAIGRGGERQVVRFIIEGGILVARTEAD